MSNNGNGKGSYDYPPPQDEATLPEGAQPVQFPGQKFSLGSVAITFAMMEERIKKGINPLEIIKRHAFGDWGNIADEEKEYNDKAIEKGEEIFSKYHTDHGEVWVFTSGDRTVTTLMIPEDY